MQTILCLIATRDDEVAVMVTIGTVQHVQIVAPVFLKHISNRNKYDAKYFADLAYAVIVVSRR